MLHIYTATIVFVSIKSIAVNVTVTKLMIYEILFTYRDVGKTSLLIRFRYDKFPDEYIPRT